MTHATTFGTAYGSASIRLPDARESAVRAFARMRAALPALPEDGSPTAHAAGAVLHFAMAAVPFGVLSYLFIAF